jgi:hypothetical protein
MLQYSVLFLLIAAKKKSNKWSFGLLSKLLPFQTNPLCEVSIDIIFLRGSENT